MELYEVKYTQEDENYTSSYGTYKDKNEAIEIFWENFNEAYTDYVDSEENSEDDVEYDEDGLPKFSCSYCNAAIWVERLVS